MNRYPIPKIFCATGAIIIFSGIFLSGLNITLGDYLLSCGIAILITSTLLLLVIIAYKLKKTNNLFRLHIYKSLEYLTISLFAIFGLASLLIFNHCITVWQRTGEIKGNLNIRQLENILPTYENYANQRIAIYKNQLDEAILYQNTKPRELLNLGFNISSRPSLESQKERKIEKLQQVLRPHIYQELTDSITTSISKFINIVGTFSPITLPKNIVRIEAWTKYYENQLNSFSHYKMKGESANDFKFESTFGNVKEILTGWKTHFLSPKRFLGYGIGIIAQIFMLFIYIKVKRSNKLNQ